MNSDKFLGSWQKIKGEIKKQWGELTDDDLKKVEGNKDKLIGLLEEKYGWVKQQAEEEVNKFYEANKQDFEEIEGKTNEIFKNISCELSKRVQEAPLKSLAMAAGAGLLLSFLLRK